VPVSSFAEASARSRAYIAQHNLGASNWTGGQIFDENDEKIARVSFDGRVWQEPLAYDPPDDPYTTLLDADKLAALKRDYETYHWLLVVADVIGSAPGRSGMIVSLEQVAGELLDEIIVDLAGETMYLPARQHLDHLTKNEQPLPDFDQLCRWISRQAGLAQPSAHELEGYYVIRLDEDELGGPFEHCLHLTFDDPETLVIGVFDRVDIVMSFGQSDLIAPPVYINLRSGQAWYEGSEPFNPGDPPATSSSIEAVDDVDG